MSESRKPYPSDVSDDEWALVVPYLTLLPENVGQRSYPLREVFNRLRYIVKTGAAWRWMPNDLPPWEIVYQQAQRWLRAGCLGTRGGFAGAAAPIGRACSAAEDDDHRQPDITFHARERSPRRLRWRQAQKEAQVASGRRYARPHTRAPRHACDPRRYPPHRIRLHHAQKRRTTPRRFITASRIRTH